MAQNIAWKDHTLDIAGLKIHTKRAGKGKPLLILHHDIGTLDRLPFYDALAASHDVIIPHYAGWGRSERGQWMRSVRDVAVMNRGLLAQLGIEKASLIGLGFGGWVAAEMATMAPRDVDKLVLVGPMGIKPPEGYILDQAILSYIDYPRAGFHNQTAFDATYGKDPTTDQLEAWDIAREMCFRIAWKPYMYSQTLPYLLASVTAPAMIVWGEQDQIVPFSAANVWKSSLPNARLDVIKNCGHFVDMEQSEVLAQLTIEFIGR